MVTFSGAESMQLILARTENVRTMNAPRTYWHRAARPLAHTSHCDTCALEAGLESFYNPAIALACRLNEQRSALKKRQ